MSTHKFLQPADAIRFERDSGGSQRMAAQKAPKGGVTIQGTFYPGGRWIPSQVLEAAAQATAQPKESTEIKSGGAAVTTPGQRAARASELGLPIPGQKRSYRPTHEQREELTERIAFLKKDQELSGHVEEYTGDGHKMLNYKLRKCPETLDCLDDYHQAMLTALEDVIDASGPLPKGTVVYRGVGGIRATGLIKKLAEAAETGSAIRLDGVQSCSLDPKTAYSFSDDTENDAMWAVGQPDQWDRLVFEIAAKTGAYVDSMSSTSGEDEVIQKHGTTYRVLRLLKNQQIDSRSENRKFDTVTVVQLEEVQNVRAQDAKRMAMPKKDRHMPSKFEQPADGITVEHDEDGGTRHDRFLQDVDSIEFVDDSDPDIDAWEDGRTAALNGDEIDTMPDEYKSDFRAYAWIHGYQDGQASGDGEDDDEPVAVAMASHRAPKGGVTIGGTFYTGGQFIPAEVMEKATAEEKAQLNKKKTSKPVSAKKKAETSANHLLFVVNSPVAGEKNAALAKLYADLGLVGKTHDPNDPVYKKWEQVVAASHDVGSPKDEDELKAHLEDLYKLVDAATTPPAAESAAKTAAHEAANQLLLAVKDGDHDVIGDKLMELYKDIGMMDMKFDPTHPQWKKWEQVIKSAHDEPSPASEDNLKKQLEDLYKLVDAAKGKEQDDNLADLKNKATKTLDIKKLRADLIKAVNEGTGTDALIKDAESKLDLSNAAIKAQWESVKKSLPLKSAAVLAARLDALDEVQQKYANAKWTKPDLDMEKDKWTHNGTIDDAVNLAQKNNLLVYKVQLTSKDGLTIPFYVASIEGATVEQLSDAAAAQLHDPFGPDFVADAATGNEFAVTDSELLEDVPGDEEEDVADDDETLDDYTDKLDEKASGQKKKPIEDDEEKAAMAKAINAADASGTSVYKAEVSDGFGNKKTIYVASKSPMLEPAITQQYGEEFLKQFEIDDASVQEMTVEDAADNYLDRNIDPWEQEAAHEKAKYGDQGADEEEEDVKPEEEPVSEQPEGTETHKGSEIPQSMEGLTKVKGLGGSTGATLYKDASGKQFVVKGGNNVNHVREEFAADQIYAAMGAGVLAGGMIGDKKATVYVEGSRQLADLSASEQKKVRHELSKHFALDALLANWDVIGLDQDNVLVGPDGKVYRGDNGGALRYRAQGGAKGSKFGEKVTELDTMRNTAYTSGQAFGHLTDAEVAAQVKDLHAKRSKLLAAAPPELQEILGKRLDNMMEWAKDKTTTAKPDDKERDDSDMQPGDIMPSFGLDTTIGRQLDRAKKWASSGNIEGAKRAITNASKGLAKLGHSPDTIKKIISSASQGKLNFLVGVSGSEPAAGVTITSVSAGHSDPIARAKQLGLAGPEKSRVGVKFKQAKIDQLSTWKHKLTSTDFQSVQSYTGSSYGNLNKMLRQCPDTMDCLGPYDRQIMKGVNAAIDAAGPLPKGTIIYRGMRGSSKGVQQCLQEIEQAVASGGTITLKGCQSCSTVARKAHQFAGSKDPVMFEIVAKTGVYVEKYTHVHGEHEVIQKHKTKYRPLAVYKQVTIAGQGTVTLVQLEEI